MVRAAGFLKGLTVPPRYIEKHKLAEMTFLYQRVFDPVSQEIVTLNPLPTDLDMSDQLMNLIGPLVNSFESIYSLSFLSYLYLLLFFSFSHSHLSLYTCMHLYMISHDVRFH